MRKYWILGLWVGIAVAALTVPLPGAEEMKDIPFAEGKAPPAAEHGMAWCLVTREAEIRTVEERVMVAPETHFMETIPATYEWKEERVLIAPEKKKAVYVPAEFKTETVRELVKEASVEYRVIPAKWEWVEKTVEVRPAYEEPVYTPASYKAVPITMEVEPERTVAKRIECEKGGADMRHTPEGICFVPVHMARRCETIHREELDIAENHDKRAVVAEMKTIRVHRLAEAARTEKVEIPAEYREVERQVLVAAPTYRFETIPAEYRTVRKLVMAQPETQKMVSIPAKYETVTRQEVVTKPMLVWRQCSSDECGGLLDKYGSVPGCVSEE